MRSNCITISSLTSGRFDKLPKREFQLTLPNYVIRSLHPSDSSKRPFEGMLLFCYFYCYDLASHVSQGHQQFCLIWQRVALVHTWLSGSKALEEASSLSKLLDGIVQKDRPVNLSPEHYFPPPYSGLLKVALEGGDFVPAQAGVLCSTNANTSIQGYKEQSTIQSVPVNKRAAAKAVFDNHFKFPQPSNRRIPLLCNVGYRGTGKSVLQALNMKWYVDKFPGALAIEVTFNDDLGFKTSRNEWNFETAVALRIVHRVLVSQLGERLGYKVFRELPEEILSKVWIQFFMLWLLHGTLPRYQTVHQCC